MLIYLFKNKKSWCFGDSHLRIGTPDKFTAAVRDKVAVVRHATTFEIVVTHVQCLLEGSILSECSCILVLKWDKKGKSKNCVFVYVLKFYVTHIIVAMHHHMNTARLCTQYCKQTNCKEGGGKRKKKKERGKRRDKKKIKKEGQFFLCCIQTTYAVERDLSVHMPGPANSRIVHLRYHKQQMQERYHYQGCWTASSSQFWARSKQ